MRSAPVITCCLFVVCGCSGKVASDKVSSGWPSHTTPDKWKEARIFHTPLDDRFKLWEQVLVRRASLTEVTNEKVFSPNKAYWFSVTEPDTMKPGPYKLQIDIYNERDYLVRSDVPNVYGNFKSEVKWINEKLLYTRVWWGRVKGVDLIFDVEKEQIIYKEMTNWGSIAFQQWQQAKSENVN
jgi:hypothetical protein